MRKTDDYTPEFFETLAELKEYANTDKKRFKIIEDDTYYFSDTPTYVIILIDNDEQNEYFFEVKKENTIKLLFVEEFEEWSIEEDY